MAEPRRAVDQVPFHSRGQRVHRRNDHHESVRSPTRRASGSIAELPATGWWIGSIVG